MHLQCGRPGLDPWVGKIPWRRAWQPTPVFLPGESPWTEEPGRLQSMWSQRVRHDWVTKHSIYVCISGIHSIVIYWAAKIVCHCAWRQRILKYSHYGGSSLCRPEVTAIWGQSQDFVSLALTKFMNWILKIFTYVFMEDRDEHYLTLDCKYLESKGHILPTNVQSALSTVPGIYSLTIW